MGTSARTRRAYRVLSTAKVRSGVVAIGFCTWKIAVEPMSAANGRADIDAGAPHWGISWDARKRRA